MPYSARIVANAFLWKAREGGRVLTHMQLQKLVYFMHAWYLAIHNKPLVQEAPQAWQYGPVFSTIYHELKAHGANPITSMLTEVNPADGRFVALMPNSNDTPFWTMLSKVWDRYHRFSAAELSSLSHEADGPWDSARKAGNVNIDKNVITDFYKRKLNASAA
jgi:uncharacterized phage-associated protein